MWLLGLLFIVFLSIAGFVTIVLILWDLYKEDRDHDGVAEYKKWLQQRKDWEAYLDKLFPPDEK